MAKLFLDLNETYNGTVGSNTQVVGNDGTETFTIATGATNVTVDSAVEKEILAGNTSDYTYKQQGNHLKIYSGTTTLISDTILSSAAPTSMQFANGTVAAQYVAGTATAPPTINLGGNAVTSAATPAAITFAALPSAVSVTTDGTSDASAAKITYTINAGNYTYNISGFGTGDALKFPSGASASIWNSSYSDGAVDLSWASGGNSLTIKLTGISTANDALLNSVADFNTVFGTGTIS